MATKNEKNTDDVKKDCSSGSKPTENEEKTGAMNNAKDNTNFSFPFDLSPSQSTIESSTSSIVTVLPQLKTDLMIGGSFRPFKAKTNFSIASDHPKLLAKLLDQNLMTSGRDVADSPRFNPDLITGGVVYDDATSNFSPPSQRTIQSSTSSSSARARARARAIARSRARGKAKAKAKAKGKGKNFGDRQSIIVESSTPSLIDVLPPLDLMIGSSTGGSLSSGQVRRLQLLYLFPRNYEFHKDEVIQLWIAQELGPVLPFADMKFYGHLYKECEELGVFQLSTLDYSTGQPRYKLSNSMLDILAHNRTDDFFRIDDVNSHISENTKHCSLWDDSIDPIALNELYKAERLATLLILHKHGSHLDQVPRDLFMNLPLLSVLDLSNTSLTELPSSIGILKYLRYLNLSYTPITALPKSLCTLYQMQTLKLKGCLKLADLPKGMRKLINLRYLEVDLDCLVVSMLPGLGDLVALQTLLAFVVGKENGCHITELKNMINLCGTLSILRLENVSSYKEAKESALDNKKYLQYVELQWTECVDGFEVLENLQPHKELEELQIVGYGGVKFPDWIGEPIFSKLATITICDCRICELLPPVGELPSLKYLNISDMHAVKKIDSTFCGKNMVTGLSSVKTHTLEHFIPTGMFKPFASLESLILNGMPMLETWSEIVEGDFPSLQKLNISHCPKLTSLPELSLLISLQQLEISLCPLLESFPNKGLPTSLQSLVIIDCPQLKVLFHKGERQDWGELGNIPNIWINYQQM